MASGLRALDRLEVVVLVDNATDSLSTNPPDVRAELPRLVGHGMTEWAGEGMCVAHHGLALFLTATQDGVDRSLLFDCGPEGAVLERNADRLGVDLAAAEALVLSHGHWDHTGGLLTALGLMRAGDGRGTRVPVHLHPGMFRQRGIRMPDGTVVRFRDVPTPPAIAAAGGEPVLAKEPAILADGAFYLSGEIPRQTPFEAGFPNHVARDRDGAEWEPDPLIQDERFLAAHVKGKGLVVFSACSHAGIINVLEHARVSFPDMPLHGALGGLHLAGAAPERIITPTVAALTRMELRRLAPGHCTGWRAVRALAEALGEETVVPLAVGKTYTF
jgi:7,8-dihydropterin-6-yl-methyl-4-(beta-D-ribofuranosyl)aminobenzene 5'-phosphate synthase